MEVGLNKIVIISHIEQGIYNWPLTFERKISIQDDRFIGVEILIEVVFFF